MTNPATPADVTSAWLYDFAQPSDGIVQDWLDRAWRLLLSKDRTIESRMADASLATEDVVDVVTAMTLRVLGNPQGKRQESIDDYSWTRDNAVSAGLLYVSDDELNMLKVPGAVRRTRSVRLVAYGES
jgi:hypothetical protein